MKIYLKGSDTFPELQALKYLDGMIAIQGRKPPVEKDGSHRYNREEERVSKSLVDNNGKAIPKTGRGVENNRWWALGIPVPLLYLPSLALIPRSKFIVGGLFGFLCKSVYKGSIAHHLGCEYFGFYGSDLWLQVNR